MPQTNYFFIDECGDPEFFGKRKKLLVGMKGFQPLLILGMVETTKRKTLQKAILDLRNNILSDTLYNTIYSVSQPNWYFHARTDHPEIRACFFNFLREISPNDLKFHAIIGRKDLQIFNRKHNNNPSEFYFDLVSHLFHNKLNPKHKHSIYLAGRAKSATHKLTSAIELSIENDSKKKGLSIDNIHYKCSIEPSYQMPELSIVDYFLWALQRYLVQDEIRFWQSIEHLSGNVVDLYGDLPNEYGGTTRLLRLEDMKPPLVV